MQIWDDSMFMNWGTWEEELAKHEAIEHDLWETKPLPPPEEAVYVGNVRVLDAGCRTVRKSGWSEGGRLLYQ
jgi:hypothetical protein